jgi:Tfp pilus assembly protein PilN
MPKISMGSLPGFSGGMPKMDRLALFAAVTWLTIVPLTGYMFLNGRKRVTELNASVEGALADSTKYANIIAANARLIARRDTIARKVAVIQTIDAGRYIWPHILDELSRSLPPYTWLVDVLTQPADSSEKTPNFRVEGRTGNNFALTKYLQDLESSPFVKNVKLISTELVRENEKLVYSFVLQAAYEEPPPDVIETVPLFAKEDE